MGKPSANTTQAVFCLRRIIDQMLQPAVLSVTVHIGRPDEGLRALLQTVSLNPAVRVLSALTL